MNNDLSCSMVKDLLPIYLDGIASEETITCVEKHLNECHICKNEYKKLLEIKEKNEGILMNETSSIKSLQKKIITSFITVIILGILLTSISIFFSYNKFFCNTSTVSDLITLILLSVGAYFTPFFGIFVAFIWKMTINKKDNTFWPNVLISFLVIWILFVVAVFLCHCFTFISSY